MKEFSWNLENLIALNDCGYATVKANCETQKIHKTKYMSIKSKICNNDEIEIIARKKKEVIESYFVVRLKTLRGNN